MRITGGETITPVAPAAHLALAATPIAPHLARSQARLVLDWWGMPPEIIETATLLISELVTNAVKVIELSSAPCHDRPKTSDQISLTLKHHDQALRIEVRDPDTHAPLLSDADLEAESGRGLMLVSALSDEWSYFFPAEGGKVVYCVIDLRVPPGNPWTRRVTPEKPQNTQGARNGKNALERSDEGGSGESANAEDGPRPAPASVNFRRGPAPSGSLTILQRQTRDGAVKAPGRALDDS